MKLQLATILTKRNDYSLKFFNLSGFMLIAKLRHWPRSSYDFLRKHSSDSSDLCCICVKIDANCVELHEPKKKDTMLPVLTWPQALAGREMMFELQTVILCNGINWCECWQKGHMIGVPFMKGILLYISHVHKMRKGQCMPMAKKGISCWFLKWLWDNPPN